ncbi:MAG: PD40 domain-containing protein [Chloroflexi bacterium]|nr:PD40 domain-containing protein [Chloroflexota bacterium]
MDTTSLRWPVIATLIVAAAILFASHSPAQTEVAPSLGWLAFDLRRGGNEDVYALSINSEGGLIRLTTDPAPDRAPAWSPGGWRLAFQSHREGNWDLYVMDLHDGQVRRVTENLAYDGAPTWSPDGASIAFESYRDGNLEIYCVRLGDPVSRLHDGGRVVRLTDERADDYSPAWSPDGRHIAFVSWRDGNKEIYLLDPKHPEAGVINLTHHPADDDQPAWSPDGGFLAFISNREGTNGIYVLDVQAALTGASVDKYTLPVVIGAPRLSSPTWAPDGRSLIYAYLLADSAYILRRGLGPRDVPQVLWHGTEWPRNLRWSGVAHVQPSLGKKQEYPPLFQEYLPPTPEVGPPYSTVRLTDVTAPQPELSDRVDDSFIALRRRVLAETGFDYLAILSRAFSPMESPESNSAYPDWHKAGRAIDILTEYDKVDNKALVLAVREDIGNQTYWRVYFRTATDDGSLGEPLVDAPWDFVAGSTEPVAGISGGRRQPAWEGYFVDFTALAADYGWQRVATVRMPGLEWSDEQDTIGVWHFENRGGLTWQQAMEEIYTPKQTEAISSPDPWSFPWWTTWGGRFDYGFEP